MPKRLRNRLGRFLSKCSNDFEPIGLFECFLKKTIKIAFLIVLLIIISPWIVLIIKSQTIRTFIRAIVHFYDEHFLGFNEDGIKTKEENNGDYFSFK